MPPDNDTKKYLSTASVSRTLLMDCVLYVSRVEPSKKKKKLRTKISPKTDTSIAPHEGTDEGRLFND